MKCPKCDEHCKRDEVDVGVGILTGPWGCPRCGWSESAEYDQHNPLNVGPDERGGFKDQFGGYHPAGSDMAIAYALASAAPAPVAVPSEDPKPPVGDAAVPSGWKLVPVEPTREMLAPFARQQVAAMGQNPDTSLMPGGSPCWHHFTDRWIPVYRAMLAAAPTPPAGEPWVEKVREALVVATNQFRIYEHAHRAKGTEEGRAKAKTNQLMAIVCAEALVLLPGAGEAK